LEVEEDREVETRPKRTKRTWLP